MDIEKLKYPVGRPVDEEFTESRKKAAIQILKNFPEELEKTALALSDSELDTPYRPGGWTKRQVIHHCGDSHMNAYIRFKLALTEDDPTIRPYDENLWSTLPDAQDNISDSLELLKFLHRKWANVLEHMNTSDFERTYFHPEQKKSSTLGANLLHYAWHARHHLAHVQL